MPPKQNNGPATNSANNASNNNNKKKKDPQPQPQQQAKPAQTQAEVPPVVVAVREKQDVTFFHLPVDPSLFPVDGPKRLKCAIKNPTSDIIWSEAGDRCAVSTPDGILVYNTPLTPGSEFTLNLHAILPYTTARYLKFSPLGNYLLSYETYTNQCLVNLLMWDLSMWSNNVYTPPAPIQKAPEATAATNQPDEQAAPTAPANPEVKKRHESVIFSMSQLSDLPTSPHCSIQWTDDEKYAFVLRNIGELLCFNAKDMSKPITGLQQKRVSLFQLSKIPKGENEQHIALFSPCHNEEPAKCTVFKTLDVVRGKSIKSGGTPPPNAPKMPPRPIVWGALKSCQTVAVFRANTVSMSWHNASQALLLKTSFDDGSGSYYGESRLYVVYVDKEAVAVSFPEGKGEIHDAAWAPTGFEFATLHGPAKQATCTLWFARECAATSTLGSGPYNTIRYHPSGRLILLAGIGSLSGKMEIWDKKTLTCLHRSQDDDSPRTIHWTPCGRYFVSATIFPFLRVGNQFKVVKFDGTVLYQEKAKMSATTLSIAPEASIITLANQGPDNGHFLQIVPNFYPRTGIFTDIKLPQELLQAKIKVEPVAPVSQKYVPPHLRDQMASAPAPAASPAAPNNGPRNLLQERKQGLAAAESGFGTKPATQASQQHHQQQQRQNQTTSNNADNAYNWRR